MSTPTMRGFGGRTPWFNNEFHDSDVSAFRLPVCEPGDSVTNYQAWWKNFGYAYLYSGQLSLVPGGTLDTGADADTIDVMNIGAPYGGDWLNHAVPATVANTSGWTFPLQNPFRPFIEEFAGGVKWDPPGGAPVGVIRKSFQWDGSYFPDTWDYVWYPISNEKKNSDAFYTYPMQTLFADCSDSIEVDGNTPTGYRLKNVSDPGHSGVYRMWHDLPGDPWATSVDNAVGYVVEFSFNFQTLTSHHNCFYLDIKDGAYDFSLCFFDGHFAHGFNVTSSPNFFTNSAVGPTYKIYTLIVQGSALEVLVNGVSKWTGTANTPTANKYFRPGYTNWAGDPDEWDMPALGLILASSRIRPAIMAPEE